MLWHQECDVPPVVGASFVPVEGLPEQEEPQNHATAFGLAHVELAGGEEQGSQAVVHLFHPEAFDAPHWAVLGYCVRKTSYETAHAFRFNQAEEARADARGLTEAILSVLEEGAGLRR
ncbi:hypothetical protein DAETH_41320 (plasmid) [Deinococcus aetherius]|uniref:Uncharacterized protein n=1 Tax=Deinococcus aetherius TaxID=200252 RepID=A0ABM8AK06_9DEIO|nr:hypothetical protein [Deinococcus aetherius]BDP44163.1 hypothetical protein DAETH_41320 [Deinococcus aetherius]